MSARRVGAAVVWVLRLAFLARLLSPDDFGAFAVALLTVGLVEALSSTGLREALVQRSDEVAPCLATVWTVELVRGAALSALLALATAPIVRFFAIPEAEVPLLIVCWLPLIDGVSNVNLVSLRRSLSFRPLFTLEMVGALFDAVVSVAIAVLTADARALAIGVVAGRLSMAVYSFALQPWTPRLELDLSRLRQLFAFSRWILGAQVISTVTGCVIDGAIARIVGADALGLLRVAGSVAVTPLAEIRLVAEGVFFPAYASIQSEVKRLRHSHTVSTIGTAAAAASVAVGIIVCAPWLVELLLGGEWMAAVPVVRLLAAWSFATAAAAPATTLLNGIGRPRFTVVVLAFTLLPCAAAAPFVVRHWGLVGVVISFLVATWGAGALVMEGARRSIGAPLLRTHGTSLTAGLLVLAALWATWP